MDSPTTTSDVATLWGRAEVAWLAEQIEVPSRRVYPRTRGGTRESSVTPRGASGLSPHTRGNREHENIDRPMLRSIPAHAGEPISTAVRPRKTRVYPRTRGGTQLTLLSACA